MATTFSGEAAIEALYVGYFGRAGDPAGVNYWLGQLNSGMSITAIAASFSVQPEAKALYSYLNNPNLGGATAIQDFINSVYQDLFNRAPDDAGKAYWTAQLTAANGNPQAIAQFILNVITGATGTDQTTIQNKVAVAQDFTDSLALANGTYNAQADATAHSVVQNTTSDPATVTAQEAVTDNFIANGGATNGLTFTLTTGIDVVSGSAGNDTILGDNNTASVADQVSGGGGSDTLKLFGLTAATLPQLNSIENLYLNAPANGLNFNVAAVTGLTSVELDSLAGANSSTLTVGSGQAVKLTNDAGGAGKITIAGNTPTSLDLTLNGDGSKTTATNVELTGTSLATLNVHGVTKDSYVNLTQAGSVVKTVNVDGDHMVTFATTALTGVSTIDASKATAGTSVIIDTGIAVKFVGGAGNDTVNVGAAGLTSADSLDAGAGTGDRFVTSQGGITAANAAGVKGFEIFDAAATITQDLDAYAAGNTFTKIVVSTANGPTLTNIGSAAINDINFTNTATSATTLSGKGFINGGISDTATLVFTDTPTINGVDVSSVTFTQVDVLNIKSVSDGSPTGFASTDYGTISDLIATDLDVLNITGDEAFSVTLDATTASVTVIDASTNTAGVRVFAQNSTTTALNVKGTDATGAAGVDQINVSNAATAATVQGGKGGDIITIDTTVNDVVKYTQGADSQAGTTTSFDQINGFGATANGNKIDVSAIGGFTGSQATVLDHTAALASINTTTLAVDAAAAANWFVDVGNVNRGVVVVYDGANTEVYVDVNHNGAFEAGTDLAIKVLATGGALAATDFTFA